MATSVNNLAGAVLRAGGDTSEAEPLYHRSLAIWGKKSLDADHPNLATTLENLAALLEHTGRPDEAALLKSRAAAIRAKRGA